MKKLLSLVLTLALTLSLLAGCSTSTDTVGNDVSTAGDTTHTTTGTSGASADAADSSVEPDGIVPGTSINFFSSTDCVTLQMPSQSPTAHWMYMLMYEPLFYSPSGEYNDITGLLAKDWTVSDDGLIWTINLHEDVYFRSGNNITAEAVISSFEVLMSEGTTFLGVESFEATGEHQLTINYSAPSPEVMLQFSGAHVGIFDTAKIDELGICPEALADAGSGPYYLSDSAAGDYMTFTANPDYWNEDRMPHIETLNCKIILNTSTQATALASGEMDYGQLADANSFELLEMEDHLVCEVQYGAIRAVWMNVTSESGVFSNPRVREALRLMLDVEQVALAGTGGYGYATDNFFSAEVPYVSTQVYDPEAGLAILAEEGIDPASIVIKPVTDAALAGFVTNIQAQFSQYGITVDFAVQDTPAMMTAFWAGEWDIIVTPGATSPYIFVSHTTMNFSETGMHNVCRDPEIDSTLWQLCEDAFSTISREEEMETLAELNRVMDENHGYMGSFTMPNYIAISADIQNVVYDLSTSTWMIWESWL